MSDMTLYIAASNCFYYPDVMLTCDPEDNREYYKQHPCLLIEVSSPSTAAVDRREKWLAYKQLRSLHYYLIVASNAHRVELHYRDQDGGWQARILDDAEALPIRCAEFAAELSPAGLYEDVAGVD